MMIYNLHSIITLIYLSTVFPGSVASNNTILLDKEAKGDIGELCVYGDNLALGYVGLKMSDRFVYHNRQKS